jgi:hypothetical protein
MIIESPNNGGIEKIYGTKQLTIHRKEREESLWEIGIFRRRCGG